MIRELLTAAVIRELLTAAVFLFVAAVAIGVAWLTTKWLEGVGSTDPWDEEEL